jgi:hypothetical protein
MPAVEQRVDRLEEALIGFAEQSKAVFAAVAAIHEDVAEIRASNARTDRALLLLRQESEERWKKFEQQAEKHREQAEKDRQQAGKERREFNKRMAEISDRVGRFVEDMVHPNAPRIAAKLFGDDPIRMLAIRVKRRHPSDPARMMELALLVAGERHVLLGEAKSTPTVEKADAFLEKMAQFADFFPEYAGHTILPMLASVSFDHSLVTYLSRRRTYALGFGDETLELLNEGEF